MNIIKIFQQNKPSVSIPLHTEKVPSPFFIVGSGRCGTTLLRRELSNVASVHIPPETFALPAAINTYRVGPKNNWDNIVDQFLATFDYHPEFEYFELPSLRPLALQLKKIPTEEQSLEKIITGIYQYHAAYHNKNYEQWGDKTPMHVWHMDTIREIYPNAKFVHLMRDGVDVVNSWVKTHENYTLEQAAKRWVKALCAFRKFSKRYPDNCYSLRYEDLVLNPAQEIKILCDFLDINSNLSKINQLDNVDNMGDVSVLEHHENVFNEVNSNSIGKGRQVFSLEDKHVLQIIIGTELSNNNYPPVI